VTVNGAQLIVNGHPEFTFVGDSSAGQTKGQNVTDEWGHWLALDANGNPISVPVAKLKAPSGGASTPSQETKAPTGKASSPSAGKASSPSATTKAPSGGGSSPSATPSAPTGGGAAF
jgi:hypothetical protein